ncbi:DsbA family protein [Bacillus sp. REN16]|nr:DsbA family protein [Bacillus sp. REN16]
MWSSNSTKRRGKKIKITLWSDFVCPFCFIGESHLNKALDNFTRKLQVLTLFL